MTDARGRLTVKHLPKIRDRRLPKAGRGFTLLELALVLAMVGVATSIGLVSLVDMVTVQKRNAALSLANLTLREQRALALETRKPRYVKPAAGGSGVVIGLATVADGTSDCVEDTGPTQTITMGGLKVGGDRVCFTADGNTDDDGASDLTFRIPGASADLAAVEVFPAGVMRWSGAGIFKMSSGLAMTSISVKTFAKASISPTFIQ